MLEVDARAPQLEVSLRAGDEPLLLMGPNGAGKSTLFKMILGILKPTSGRIALGGRALFDSARRIDLPPEARRLGYVPQQYALFPHLDVAGNVGFGLERNARERLQRALQLLRIEPLARRRVQTLSGGERQKVALARALAPQPQALLLDEPFAALDAQARKQLRAQLAAQLADWKLPALIISHDPSDAVLARRIVVLEGGRIVQQGALEELRARPATAFIGELTES